MFSHRAQSARAAPYGFFLRGLLDELVAFEDLLEIVGLGLDDRFVSSRAEDEFELQPRVILEELQTGRRPGGAPRT